MNICIKCKKEMICKKTGVTIHYGNGHCYSGDLFECNFCKSQIVNTSGIPHQRNPKIFNSKEVVIEMYQ